MSTLFLSKTTASSKLITIDFFAYITDGRPVTSDGTNQLDDRYFKKPSSKKLA